MSDPDKKTYRIWLNPEAPAKIENVWPRHREGVALGVTNYETKRWEPLPEEESKAIETQTISIGSWGWNQTKKWVAFGLSDKDFASSIEVDFRVIENSSIPSLRNILVLFNGVPGICLFDQSIPEECPDERIFALVGSGQNVSESQFQNLSTWLNLTNLDLLYCKSLTNVDGLSGLTNLTDLYLHECKSLTNVDGLSGLTNLTDLYLHEWESLTNLDGLSGCTNLTRLDLQRCSSLTNVDGLSGLTNLTSLNLRSCSSLKNVDILSGLTNLTSLNLYRCSSLTNMDALSCLTNLTELNLSGCVSLTNVDGLSGLTNLANLNLRNCHSLTNLDGLSGCTNLTRLDLQRCSSLTNVDGLSGLTNLTSLDLGGCSSLTNVVVLSNLTNLKSLDLSFTSLTSVDILNGLTNLTRLDLQRCSSLTNVDILNGLTNLTSLNLRSCSCLKNVDGLSGCTNLTSLNLGCCSSLTNFDGLSGLTNLTVLILAECKSLTNVDILSGLTNLTSLNLYRCSSLTNMDALSCLTNLTELNLSGCGSLTNVDALSGLTNLISLDLSDCEVLTNVDVFSGMTNLRELVLWFCSYLKKINQLKNCSNLRELEFNDPVEVARVLSQTGREDEGFVKDMAQEWLEVAMKTAETEALVCDLSETFGLYAKESWAIDALSQLVKLMLGREVSSENTWGSLLGATAGCPENSVREILECVTDDMNQERASSVLRPLLKTFASLPESLCEWSNERADELLDSLSIEFLRDYGPSVCLFYARTGRDDRLRSWLEKLTDPETPLWRDRIHLALGQWEIERGDFDSPRARLKEMSQGTSKDELLETLARALAKEKPLEAGELLDQISEEWRQANLSAELAEEAAFTEPAENAYRLLLHMERDPDKLADWVATLTRNHPDSELAKEVARTFGPAGEKTSKIDFSGLLDEFLASDAIRDRVLKKDRDEFRQSISEKDEGLQSLLVLGLLEEMRRQGRLTHEESKDLENNPSLFSSSEPTDIQ